jgi:hypothetical protein
MAGMRDRLIHGYGTVDLDVLWKTVTEDLATTRPADCRSHPPGADDCWRVIRSAILATLIGYSHHLGDMQGGTRLTAAKRNVHFLTFSYTEDTISDALVQLHR